VGVRLGGKVHLLSPKLSSIWWGKCDGRMTYLGGKSPDVLKELAPVVWEVGNKLPEGGGFLLI